MEPQKEATRVIIEKPESNGMATASLVLGIIGVVLNLVPIIPYILGILAIIFGVVGGKRNTKTGVAKAGLILGIVTLIFKVLFWIWMILMIGTEVNSY